MSWLVDAQPLSLTSALSPAECGDRLRRAVSNRIAPLPLRSFVGFVDGDAIYVRKAIWYRNTLQRPFYGTMMHCGDGTRIDGRFRVAPVCTVANAAMLVLFPLAFVYLGFTDPAQFGGPIGAVAAFAMMALVLWGALTLGRRIAADEPALITQFLVQTLEARVVGNAVAA